MSDHQRRATARFGRAKSKDPRADSVPPSSADKAERAARTKRNSDPRILIAGAIETARPPARNKHAAAPAAPAASAAAPRPATDDPIADLRTRLSALETDLRREKAERAAEADLMGQMLARATQAEARVRVLEQSLARVNEERVVAEAKLQGTRGELEELLADQRATYEAQLRALQGKLSGRPPGASDSRHDTGGELKSARALATELLKTLDKLAPTKEGKTDSSRMSSPASRRG